MKRFFNFILSALFIAAIFASGVGVGMCIKVFMVRGVPMIHGGGEIMLLLMIPAAVYTGYRFGIRKRRKQESKELEEM